MLFECDIAPTSDQKIRLIMAAISTNYKLKTYDKFMGRNDKVRLCAHFKPFLIEMVTIKVLCLRNGHYKAKHEQCYLAVP